MDKRRVFLLILLLSLATGVSAQQNPTGDSSQPAQEVTRPRVVAPAPQPSPATPTVVTQASASTPAPVPLPTNRLSLDKIRARTAEADRMFKARPVPMSMVVGVPAGTPSIDFVTIAALDTATSKINLIVMPKVLFLQKGAVADITTSEGVLVKLTVLRANGVNTAVTIVDQSLRHLIPLVVQYPVERGGKFLEMAYYKSAHPALLSPEVVKAGQLYVRTMIDLAAKRLRLSGIVIAPEILDIAERLCVVEHTDHDRFRRENRIALYEEIFALFALNELETYRYAVSFAGAGGMVQMIPATYRMVRNAHPGVGLNPDFIAGMRNHGNALEAMLLYMNDTWSDLSANEEVANALSTKIASRWELMAAGYNSNPARLPGYLKRGGNGWRGLIPRETQLYLQIYRSLDSLVPMKSRSGQ